MGQKKWRVSKASACKLEMKRNWLKNIYSVSNDLGYFAHDLKCFEKKRCNVSP